MVNDIYYEAPDSQNDEIITNANFETSFGEDENIVTLKRSISDPILQGGFIYSETDENGGIIDSMEEVTGEDGEVTYSGRSYTGILDSHVIRPEIGTLSGDANDVIAKVIDHLDLGDVFKASPEKSGIAISYEVDDYLTGYSGLCAILKSSNAKLSISHTESLVELSALPVASAGGAEFGSDNFKLTIKKVFRTTNHMICLGPSEVIDLYVDESGNVSKTQHFFGVDQITSIFDQRETSSDDLEEKATEELLGLQDADSCEIDLLSDDESLDVGDIISGVDDITGVEVVAVVKQKSFSISENEQHHSYEAGNPSMTQSKGGYSGSSNNSDGSVALGFKVGDTLVLIDGVLDAKVSPEQLESLSQLVTTARQEASNAEATANQVANDLDTKAEFEHYHDASDITTGVLDQNHGGTGSDNTKGARYNLLGDIESETSIPGDESAVVFAYGSPSISNGAIFKRSLSSVWDWIYQKIKSAVKPTDISAAASGHVHDVATAASDGFMSADDREKLDGISDGANKTVVDSSLSDTSANPVQNKVVKSALDDKADSDHEHSYAASLSPGGSASSAEKLKTARTITFQGAVSGSFSFDGSENVTVNLEGDSQAAGFLAAHPIGSIFFTTNSTDPGDTYGGVWKKLPSDNGGYLFLRES